MFSCQTSPRRVQFYFLHSYAKFYIHSSKPQSFGTEIMWSRRSLQVRFYVVVSTCVTRLSAYYSFRDATLLSNRTYLGGNYLSVIIIYRRRLRDQLLCDLFVFSFISHRNNSVSKRRRTRRATICFVCRREVKRPWSRPDEIELIRSR